ncbi:hypothetical protein KXD93_18575 [Mucilaginibacter sp. BJC16-A38]|uniref:hypothetical protein n=1 Tax=Mucilaginibacter phenanthrenivorans TaxID=1234842 RepID=UPI0021574D80|nr:hypothetical protein [Mucilaginibacter phenanthrenivorans]MCR8559668.1 hypothetical protein [Mucilaginibacter phenanthrenivorans]
MKTSFFIAAFCLLALSIFVGWAKLEHNNDDISIAVSDTDDTYTFKASFNENTTGKVQDFMNDSMRPNGIFRSTSDNFNVTTTLKDGTDFYIKESPGELKVEIDKRKNSTASFLRIKKMCDGVAKILKGR